MEMCSNRGRRILVLVYALMQMPPHVTNITCITQVTFKSINKGLMVDNRRLNFAQFQIQYSQCASGRNCVKSSRLLSTKNPLLTNLNATYVMKIWSKRRAFLPLVCTLNCFKKPLHYKNGDSKYEIFLIIIL